MGKPTGDDQARGDPESGVEVGGGDVFFRRCFEGRRGVRSAFSFRCVLVLLLGACVFLSAVFWLPPFQKLRSRTGGGTNTLSAPIQASFILKKPRAVIIANTGQLEYDIFDEIGVPNTKVSIITTQSTASNSTYVVFGVFPDSKNAVISPVVLSVLRSSLIELVLQQSNLSLASSIFGQPSSFEVLKFPGGITVIPAQTGSIWQTTQILFNFTLNNSIVQIERNLDELKDQLKFGLRLRSYENVYVQMTNVNGSTVAPPVIVEASVLSDVGSHNLLPPRLKQLAQTITGTPAKNLGLDHSVFGKVKEVRLSQYLNNSITSVEPPTPSPSPSDEHPSSDLAPVSPYHAPSRYAPIPSPRSTVPCLSCETSPVGSPPSHSTASQGGQKAPSPQHSASPLPSTSSTARAPESSPCLSPSLSPDAAPPVIGSHAPGSDQWPYEIAPAPHKPGIPEPKMAPLPHKILSPTPTITPSSHPMFYGMSPQYSKRNGRSGKAASPALASSPTPSPPLVNSAAGAYLETRLVLLLPALLVLHFFC